MPFRPKPAKELRAGLAVLDPFTGTLVRVESVQLESDGRVKVECSADWGTCGFTVDAGREMQVKLRKKEGKESA